MRMRVFQIFSLTVALSMMIFLNVSWANNPKADSDQKIFALVNVQSKVNSISRGELRILFLKQGELIRDNESYQPLDGPELSEVRDLFYKRVVGNSRIDMKRYWSRMIFTGKSVPPVQAKSEADVEDQIASNQWLIGYSIKKSNNPKIRSLEISE